MSHPQYKLYNTAIQYINISINIIYNINIYIYTHFWTTFKFINIYSDSLLFWGGCTPKECIQVPSGVICPYLFFNKNAVFYPQFVLPLSLFYTDQLISTIVFNHVHLNSMRILCLFFPMLSFCKFEFYL